MAKPSRKQQQPRKKPSRGSSASRKMTRPRLHFDEEKILSVDFSNDRFHGLLRMDDKNAPAPPDGTRACTRFVLLSFYVVFGVAMVVAGRSKVDECPAEPMIPKYLIGKNGGPDHEPGAASSTRSLGSEHFFSSSFLQALAFQDCQTWPYNWPAWAS